MIYGAIRKIIPAAPSYLDHQQTGETQHSMEFFCFHIIKMTEAVLMSTLNQLSCQSSG